jgi:type IV secretory pathway VirB10-like protein
MIKLIQRLIERVKKNNSSPKPPESGFSEKPEGWEKDWHRIRDLVRNRFVLWSAALLIAAFGSYVVMSHKTPKPKAVSVPASEQNRVAMTAASMERAIDASFRSKEPQASVKPLKILPRTKRKLDSAMGVFLFKKEPERVIQTGIERPGKTKLGLASGTKIPALLGERVFSFNVDAPVVALVSKDFMAGEKTVIPKGSKFLGEANVLKSLDRINVRFQLLVLPDGREIRVNALALSEDGAAGIKGKVEKHTDKKIVKALGESVLSMGALFLGGRSQDPFSMQNQMELNLAQNLSDEARRNLRNVNVEKSVTVEASKPIFVFLLEAV